MGSIFECRDVVRGIQHMFTVILTVILLVCTVHSALIALDVSGKSATQKGTVESASRAIDGNVKTACQTQADFHPWWKLDLGGEHWIGVITVTNKNVDGWRFAGAVTRAGKSPDTGTNKLCGSPATGAQATNGAVIEFRCDPPLLARYVSVEKDFSTQKNGDRFLHFAELTIMEYVSSKCDGREGDSGLFDSLCEGCLIVKDNLLTAKLTKSLKECTRFCVEDAGCKAFDFAPGNGSCHLHASTDAGWVLNSEFVAYKRTG